MKKLLLTLLSLLTTTFQFASDTLHRPTHTPIASAWKQGAIELRITGTFDPRMYKETVNPSDGFYFGKCILLYLANKTDSVLELRMECGQLLVPEDSTVQTMMVTHEVIISLNPGDNYYTRCYAMCSELHDAPPMAGVLFELGPMGNPDLIRLAKYLESHQLQNQAGQHAVWAYTDQANDTTLIHYGADSISLSLTREILEAVSLTTPLDLSVASEAKDKNSNTINIRKSVFYTAIVVILVLGVGVVVVLLRNKIRAEK